METKHIGTIIALALCFGVYFYFTQTLQDQQRDMMYEAEGYVEWDEEEARDLFNRSDELLGSAMQELQAHEREKARLLYREAMSNVALYLQNHRDKNLEPDLTVSDWKKLRDGIYLGSLNEEFDFLEGELARGDVKVEEVEWFVRGYGDPEFSPLRQAFEQSKSELESLRAQQAPKWLRIYVQDSSGGQRHEKPIESEIVKKWTPDYGFKAVFGKSLGNVEKKATWKTLTIWATEESAYYEYQNRSNNFDSQSPPVIPYKLTLKFSIEGSEKIPTSWDDLPEIIVEAPVPDTLLLEDKSYAEGDRLEAENRKVLLEKMQAAMGALPSFRPFPELDADQLSILGAGGKVDRQAATALAYLKPEKFSNQLQGALQTVSKSGRGELMGLIIELGLEEHSGWLIQSLTNSDLYSQQQVFEAIQNKPWFGDWEPAVMLLRKGHDNIRTNLMRKMGDHVSNPKVKGALIEIGNDPKDPRRLDFARYLIQHLPEEELAPYAVWVDDRDTRFSEQIFTLLRRKDQELGRQIILAKYATANAKLREAMLNGYKFNYESIAPAEIDMLKSAVQQRASPKLHTNALNALLKAAYYPEVWACLLELKNDVGLSEREKNRVEEALLNNVNRARPDFAKEYNLAEVARLEASAASLDRFARSRQGTAITNLLGMKGSKDASVKSLSELMGANPGDEELSLMVIRAIQQFHRIRKGWDWGQAELVAILTKGMAHPNKEARKYSYKVAGFALKEGYENYRNLLVVAADRETDSKLKTQIQGYLR